LFEVCWPQAQFDNTKQVSASKLAKLYQANMKFASNSEVVSTSFVECAITIDKRILSIAANSAVLENCDEQFVGLKEHPFQSVYVLNAVCERVKSETKMTWVLQGLIDQFQMKFIDMGSFTHARMKCPKQSYCMILDKKMDAKDHLLGPWLEGLDVPPVHKSKAREVFGSFASVRKHYCALPGDSEPDLTYQAGWPESSTMMMSLMDDVVYNNTFDNRYKDAIKSGLTISDFLDYPSVVERLSEIKDKITAEKGGDSNALTASEAADAAAAAAAAVATAAGPNSTECHGITSLPESRITKEAKGFENLSEEDKQAWTRVIKKNIHSNVKLLVDDGTANGLIDKIRGCPLAMVKGDATGLIMFHYDSKKHGEANTRPDLRTTSIRDAIYTRLVSSVLAARQAEDDEGEAGLHSGELALLFDGGKTGNKSRLLGPWKPQSASKKQKEDQDEVSEDDDEAKSNQFVPALLQVVKTEASILARKKLVRGCLSIRQIEGIHIASHNKIVLPERAWQHYPGSNNGDTISG
jgi:hypothetical protein